jgi:hypothetical protein
MTSTAIAAWQVRHRDDHCAFASFGSVLAAFWWGDPEIEDLERLDQHQEELIEANRGGISLVVVITNLHSQRADARLRAEAIRMTQRFADRVRVHAHVVCAAGMVGSFIRAYIAGVHLVSRYKVPHRVFGSLTEALTWVLDHPRQDAEVRRLRRSVEREILGLFRSLPIPADLLAAEDEGADEPVDS